MYICRVGFGYSDLILLSRRWEGGICASMWFFLEGGGVGEGFFGRGKFPLNLNTSFVVLVVLSCYYAFYFVIATESGIRNISCIVPSRSGGGSTDGMGGWGGKATAAAKAAAAAAKSRVRIDVARLSVGGTVG